MSRTTKFWSYFGFSSLYYTWKDHLYRISGSKFYEWLFVPEKFRDFRESYLIDWATIPKEKARQQSLSVVSCVGKRVEISLFRLNFSPNTSLDIPSLHNMSSLILKKNVHGVSRNFCEFFQANNRAFILRGIIMEIYTTTNAWKVSYRVYMFSISVNVTFAGRTVIFPVNTVAASCNGSASTLLFYNQSFYFYGIFSFHSIVLLVIIMQLTAV